MYLGCPDKLNGLGAGYTIRTPSMPLITIAPGSGADTPVYSDYSDYSDYNMTMNQDAPLPTYSADDYYAAVPQPDQQPAQTSYDYPEDYNWDASPQSAQASYEYPEDYNWDASQQYVQPVQQFQPAATTPYDEFGTDASPVYQQQADNTSYEDARAFYDSLPQNIPASHYIEMYGPEPEPQQYVQPVYVSPVQTYSPPPVAKPVSQPVIQQAPINVSSSGGGASVNFNPNIITSVPTNIATQVSPQISPVFVQQEKPVDSGVSAGTTQYGTTGSGGGGSSAMPSGGSYMSKTAQQQAATPKFNWLPLLAVAAILGVAAMPEDNRRTGKR